MAYPVFEQLAIGEYAGPIELNETSFALVQVTNRVAARQVADKHMEAVRKTAIDDWFANEYGSQSIEIHVSQTGTTPRPMPGSTGSYSACEGWISHRSKKNRGPEIQCGPYKQSRSTKEIIAHGLEPHS